MKVQVSRDSVTVRAREIFDVADLRGSRLGGAAGVRARRARPGHRHRPAGDELPRRRSRRRRGSSCCWPAKRRGSSPARRRSSCVVRDLEGKKIARRRAAARRRDRRRAAVLDQRPVAPGSYIVRARGDGQRRPRRLGRSPRRGQPRAARRAVRDRSAAGARARGRPRREPRLALDGVRQDERLALRESISKATAAASTAPACRSRLPRRADGPALVQAPAELSARARASGSMLAQAVADMRVLPPGNYVARAKVTVGQRRARRAAPRRSPSPTRRGSGGRRRRRVGGRSSAPRGAARARPRAPIGAVPAFAIDQVLAPHGPRRVPRPRRRAARCRVAGDARAARARADRRASTASPSPTRWPREAPVAAFLSGLTLLAQTTSSNPAANAFRSAMRGSADFYPAMVYLGACYAAGGNDKEAAGAWRTALIKEGDALALHLLLADALLRQGRGDLALEALDGARARWPAGRRAEAAVRGGGAARRRARRRTA